MNLLCFTLEGSTDGIYEPAYSKSIHEAIPQYRSALLRHKSGLGGSDPCIHGLEAQQTHSPRFKWKNRRSHIPVSTSAKETFDNKDMNDTFWMSSSNSTHQMTAQTTEMCDSPWQSSMLVRNNRAELNYESGKKDLPTKRAETTPRGTLKRLQKLVHVKKRGNTNSVWENHDAVFSEDNKALSLSCMGLMGRSAERLSNSPPAHKQQQDKDLSQLTDIENLGWNPEHLQYHWSPSECPQNSLYHTCHLPPNEPWVCDYHFTLLPRTTKWDHFESLVHELDAKQCDLSPPFRSVTDLDFSKSTWSPRFGRFDALKHHYSLMEPQDKGRPLGLHMERGHPSKSSVYLGKEMIATQMICTGSARMNHVEVLPKELSEEIEKDEANNREASCGRSFTEGYRRSSNSLESLYSLSISGQSSSSGVTSGSGCSSNRGSLRLAEDVTFTTQQFCGRATVHTDFVPSPYDTESLTLKVGDIIDIIAKPPMGIWTGMLDNKIGSFKFVYVDVLKDKGSEPCEKMRKHRMSQRSTSRAHQEALEHPDLQRCASAAQLSRYQTVDDLMRLLREMDVTHLEHMQCMPTAVQSLRILRSGCPWENVTKLKPDSSTEPIIKANTNNHSRDSGCHVPSDCSDNGKEDTEFHFPSTQFDLAETGAT